MFQKKLMLVFSALLLVSFYAQATEVKNIPCEICQDNPAPKSVASKAKGNPKVATKPVATEKTKVKKTQPTNTQKTVTEPQTQANAQQATMAQDLNLKAFNKNVSITLVQRGTALLEDQPVAILVYEATNKSRNRIKNLQWLSAFTIENQVFFVQEIKTDLDKPINAKKKENITVTLPLEKLPENVKSIFANNETPIGHLTVAKQIDFSNGRKIIVTE